MAARKPTGAEMAFLLLFHATLSGAFLVAYLTGDEDTYRMHVFSGYAALAALAARVAAGLAAAEGSPLRFPRPSVEDLRRWTVRLAAGAPQARAARSPLIPWMAAALLIGVGATALSGAVADFVTLVEDLHEALGEIALWIVLGHIALVIVLHRLKRPRPLGAPA
ncbi:MAG TPA: cytochrome b/b6 domain-containing protein [Azospirillum sp.]|nr:cytochrome b/b6 domain-containing protein [Azospirillum sp.]